jgi:hypothetical protein
MVLTVETLNSEAEQGPAELLVLSGLRLAHASVPWVLLLRCVAAMAARCEFRRVQHPVARLV